MINGFFVFELQNGENMTREQLEHEIRKLKEAHAEDQGKYLSNCNCLVNYPEPLIMPI